MTSSGHGPVGVASAAGRGRPVERWAGGRLLLVDNLKVVLIAAIIVGHAVVGYGETDWWAYSEP